MTDYELVESSLSKVDFKLTKNFGVMVSNKDNLYLLVEFITDRQAYSFGMIFSDLNNLDKGVLYGPHLDKWSWPDSNANGFSKYLREELGVKYDINCSHILSRVLNSKYDIALILT